MTPSPTRPSHAPLPYGVRDLFLTEAASHAALSDAWRALFRSWGYGEVITPTYEHYDVLLRGYGADQEADLYRVLDREGAVMALRPDVTTQVARLAATKLAAEPRPLRFSYVANVFRYDEPQAGRQREFFQAGVELIGASSPQADAEILELAVEALRVAGLRGFQINLGHMGLFRGILGSLELRSAETAALRRAVDRKDATALAGLLDEGRVPPGPGGLLRALPELCGGSEVIEHARGLARSAGSPVASGALAALDRLEQVFGLLAEHGIADHVILDLGEVRGMGYYTGVNFEGFVEGSPFAICSGGRYDNLVGIYGPPSPAVGFALGLERVQMALQRQGVAAPGVAPDVILSSAAGVKSREAVRRLRERGVRVAVDPAVYEDEALMDFARGAGIGRVILDGGREAVVLDSAGQRRVAWSDLEEALGS